MDNDCQSNQGESFNNCPDQLYFQSKYCYSKKYFYKIVPFIPHTWRVEEPQKILYHETKPYQPLKFSKD